MKAAYLNLRILALLSFFALSYSVRSQQFSAGINTETPNPKAVLHLVSPNSDQGLIIPIIANRAGMGLTASDNGMLVFDSSDGLFYYYFNGWFPVSTTDSQTLSISGTSLTITNGNTIDIAQAETDPTVLANVKDGVDWSELIGIPGVFADNLDDVNDLDADPANETISSTALAGNILTITEAGTPHSVDLSTLATASQDLQFAGNILSITGDPTPTSVDFTGWDINAADDITTANVGTAANQIVQLDGLGALPAVDGSNLTGVTSTVTTDGTTITGDGSGTALSVGLIQLTNIGAGTAIAGQVVEFDGTNWVHGTDDVGMLAATYDPNTIAGDAFNFGTHASTTAAVAGNVLTFNGTTWDAAAPTGLTLPYSQTLLNVADLFALTNTGTGGAGNFAVNNLVNAGNALSASTNGTGSALNVSHAGTGVGVGVNVAMTSATGTGPALNINHAGLGPGIEILTTTGPPLFISGGAAGDVLTSDGLGNITLQPGGLTLPYTQTVTNAGDLFHLINDGTGGAGAFQILNAANAATALSANTNGSGSVILASHTGASGPGIDVSITGAANPSAGLLINHAGTGPGIEVTTASGPNITLNGATPFFIPTGATLGHVLTSDASGNAAWSPPLTLPYANSVADAGPLFSISNSGTGPAAFFVNTSGSNAIAVNGVLSLNGNIEMQSGAPRAVGILPGASDNLTLIAGSSNGTDGTIGGNLILRGGDGGAPTGNGGNIELIPGSSSANGGILAGGVTRFRNPATGVLGGGTIELEDDGGANALAIHAHQSSNAYDLIFPQFQGAGALTNDGSGNLSWNSAGGFTAPLFQDATNVVFGSATAGFSVPAPNFQLGAIAPASGGQAMLSASSFGFQSQVPLLRANGTQGGEIALITGDVIGEVAFIGFDGGGYQRQGMIRGVANENWTAASRGTELSFFATPSGTSTDQEVMRISGNGVQINGIPRINNPIASQGGAIDILDDLAASTVRIQAPATLTNSYAITLPLDQGAGALTNDGTGVLTWETSGGAFLVDANNNHLGGTTTGTPGTGIDNIIIGPNAGFSVDTGNGNIILGRDADVPSDLGDNVVIGALASSRDSGIAIGRNATANFSSIALGQIAVALDNSIAIGIGASSQTNSIALGLNVSASSGTAIIGDPGNPLNVGIGTGTPTARMSVQTLAAESIDVLNLTSNGTAGRALVIDVPLGGSPDAAVLIAQNSTGSAIDARITDSGSLAPIINAQHQGDGNVAFFNQGNILSGADAMFVQTQGLGSAGVFQISNTGSGAPALAVNSNGDNSNAIAISKAGLNGAGIAIDMNGQGAQGIFVGGTNPASSSIETDGDVLFRANLITPPINHDANILPIPSDSRIVKINNAGPDVDQIAPGVEGQEIILIGDNGVPPFNIIIGGNLRLDNNGNHPMGAGASIHFVYIETLSQWIEISRSR